MSPKEKNEALRMTARDLLEARAGKEHALHTVIAREPSPTHDTLAFRCSCGAVVYAPYTAANVEALRNITRVNT